MQETELVKRLQQRDEAAVGELQRRFVPLIRYVIAPILPDPQDREDCLSEVLLRVWERIGSYRAEKGNFTTWLTALSRNAALNFRRGLPREEPLSGVADVERLTPEEALLAKERRQALYQALQSLSLQDRLLFYRKYYYFQSTHQIAAEMGLTPRAVEGRLYRIKGRLRKLLGGEDRA